MGQPPPTTSHRVPGGREPHSQGAMRSVDRRPAPAARGAGPATRSPSPEAGGDHRDARHDPAGAPAGGRRGGGGWAGGGDGGGGGAGKGAGGGGRQRRRGWAKCFRPGGEGAAPS